MLTELIVPYEGSNSQSPKKSTNCTLLVTQSSFKEKQKKLFSCGFSQKSTASLILSNFLMLFLSKCPPGVKTNYIQKVQGLGFMGDAIRSEI